jgi:hypothetical protein
MPQLFDHQVGTGEQPRQYIKPKRLGSSQVDRTEDSDHIDRIVITAGNCRQRNGFQRSVCGAKT